MSTEIDMSNKVVLVTGGTKGIGKGISLCFLKKGAQVIVCARNEPEEPIAIDNNEALFLAGDIREPEIVDQIINTIIERFGHIDILVNNAGGTPPVDAATASMKFSELILKLNLLVPLNFSQAVNRHMQEQDNGGQIINIASVSGVRPSPGSAIYGAAKAGLLSLTKSLAIEWAPKVRLNAIIVGLAKTEKVFMHYGDEESIAATEANIPMRRMASPEDVGNACLLLCSSLAQYTTGGSLTLDGGGEIPPFLSHQNKDTK